MNTSNIINLFEKPESKGEAKVLDADILGYLLTERTTSEVRDYFMLSTASKRLRELLDAKKVLMRRDGARRFWKKA
jgi:hypothetical protein